MVAAAVGGAVTMGALSWKFFRWANARVEREKAITNVLLQFPTLVQAVAQMGETLLTLTTANTVAVRTAAQREDSAAKERTLQMEERARVLLRDEKSG